MNFPCHKEALMKLNNDIYTSRSFHSSAWTLRLHPFACFCHKLTETQQIIKNDWYPYMSLNSCSGYFTFISISGYMIFALAPAFLVTGGNGLWKISMPSFSSLICNDHENKNRPR